MATPAAPPAAPTEDELESRTDDETPQPTDAQPTPEETGDPDAQTGGAKTYRSWTDALDDVSDNEELLKHPRLSGLLGDLAERRRKATEPELRERLRAEIQAEIDAEHEAERQRQREADLDRAADEEDLLTLGEAELKRRRETRERKMREEEASKVSQTASKLFEEQASTTLNRYVDGLPPEVRERLHTRTSGKQYEGSWGDGYVGWLGDVVDSHVEHARERWEKDLVPELRAAIRKEVLAELNGGKDSSPDLTQGAASGGALTQAEWQDNRGNAAWRRANRDRIDAALAAGGITN